MFDKELYMDDFPRDPLQWDTRANLPQAQHSILSITFSQATPGKELLIQSLEVFVVSQHTQGRVPPQGEATRHKGVVLC